MIMMDNERLSLKDKKCRIFVCFECTTIATWSMASVNLCFKFKVCSRRHDCHALQISSLDVGSGHQRILSSLVCTSSTFDGN
jgi:hypothetical protein